MLVGAQYGASSSLQGVKSVCGRMAIAVVSTHRDERYFGVAKVRGLLLGPGRFSIQVVPYFVEVNISNAPVFNHGRKLVVLGVAHKQASPLPLPVSVDVRICQKAHAVGVAAFVGECCWPDAGEG